MMNKTDTGIEKESILFVLTQDLSNTKILEIRFSLSGNSFKMQLPIFREGTPEEFLLFLYEFIQAKPKLGHLSHQKLESSFKQLLQGKMLKVNGTQ